MPLYTDGTISSIEELLASESAILEVAKTERIDLAIKLSLAHQEIGIELTCFLAQHSGSDFQGILWTKPELKKVVVTEALHKWHTFQTLGLVYRDAYNSQLNDRYLGKWREYERLAKWASRALFQTGVGMVSDPIPQAKKPQLSHVAGALAAATYFARAAWVNGSGVEGNPSELAVLSAPDSSLVVASAVNPPGNAKGWNVYVGLTYASVTLQNEAPIPVGQSWTEPATGLSVGRNSGTGQAPEYYITINRNLQRG